MNTYINITTCTCFCIEIKSQNAGLNETNCFMITFTSENSNYWEGPNSDEAFDCYVRVRAWKMSSFPKPDFHFKGLEIKAACQNGKLVRYFYQIML